MGIGAETTYGNKIISYLKETFSFEFYVNVKSLAIECQIIFTRWESATIFILVPQVLNNYLSFYYKNWRSHSPTIYTALFSPNRKIHLIFKL